MLLWLLDCCCVSVQGLRPLKDSTSSAVVKCVGLSFGAFPGCVTRCFTLTSRLSFLFFRRTENLGICEAMKDCGGASSRNREKKEHLEEPSDWDRLCAAL